jgi:hypothetical protein
VGGVDVAALDAVTIDAYGTLLRLRDPVERLGRLVPDRGRAEVARAFEAEAANFNRVVQGSDVEAMRAAQAALGNSCKNCHDRFRAPED